MTKRLIWTGLLLTLIAIAIFAYFSLEDPYDERQLAQRPQYVPGTLAEFPKLANELAGKINEISPTQSFDELGWIPIRISFVPNEALAYIEYTDTHVALRLLAQYGRLEDDLQTSVLATFIPKETGGWELQYGRDIVAGSLVSNYRFDGEAEQWIPEVSGI